MPLTDAIKKIIKGEVLDDDQTLAAYSKDASIFEIKPKVVTFPNNAQDLKALIDYAISHPEVSLTPRSAGTDMSGGAINDSVILDMTKHFNKIVEIGEDFAITQPGVFYRDFEKETLKHNLLLPCYPASRELNTVGGMVANNSAGEKTLTYGQTKDFVESLKVVLSDGNEYEIGPLTKSQLDQKMSREDFEGKIYKSIYRLIEENYEIIQDAKPKVHKNSSGYLLWEVWDRKIFNLSKLIVGSQGTLGLVTETKFRLIKPKANSNILIIFMKNLDNLDQIVNKVLSHQPESFESFDDYTLKVAMKFLPEVFKIMKVSNIFELAVQFLPEMWMSLTGGVPKLILIAEFTGDSKKEVDQKCQTVQKDLIEFKLRTRIAKSEEEARKYWIMRRESFNLLRHHAGNLRTAPFIDDIIVNPEKLPDFLPELQKILGEYKLIYTIAGHIGDGNFHIIPLMDFTDPKSKEIIGELGPKVYDLIIKFKGSITAEHNDGLVRGPYLEKMFGEDIYQLFKEVKSIFDPKHIFNPHKKADATFEYSYNHLSKS